MAFGVSNSFKRGTIKTYNRQQACFENISEAEYRPRKRICMAPSGHVIEKILNDGTTKTEKPKQEMTPERELEFISVNERVSLTTSSSSPLAAEGLASSPRALSSDSDLSSLPSSPPQLPSPLPTSRKPTFSFLKRKRLVADENEGSRPLSSITANAQRGPRPTKKAMTQMQIDLGGEVRKTCRTCGMEYIPSVKEDTALHKEFCGMNIGGIEMGRPFMKDDTIKKIRSKKVLGSDKESVVMIDGRCSLAAQHKARKVLDVVNTELNAVDTVDKTLWGERDGEQGETRPTGKRKSNVATEKKVERFKVFLYLINDKCVGFCLAEKVSHAYPVISGVIGRKEEDCIVSVCNSSSILHSTSAEIVLLGISRIWTSKSYRGQGLASTLLDCARSNFFYGVEVPRHLVAFSQPSESGGRLARRWFESETGWHVYSESQI